MRALLLLLVLLTAACGEYQPPSGILSIYNNSDTAVYLYWTCDDSIGLTPELKSFNEIPKDSNAVVKKSEYAPEYKIYPRSYSNFPGFGTLGNRSFPCENKKMNFFFIADTTINRHDWKEIVYHQLYQKKVVLTNELMNKSDWTYEFTPR